MSKDVIQTPSWRHLAASLVIAGVMAVGFLSCVSRPSESSTDDSSSSQANTSEPEVGKRVYFDGVVTEVGKSIMGQQHFVKIETQGLEVKCYGTEASPSIGSNVTIVGTVSMWLASAGGNLRPCAILSR